MAEGVQIPHPGLVNLETGPNRVLLLRTCPRIWNHEQRNGFRCHDFGSKTTPGRPGRPTISTRFGPLSTGQWATWFAADLQADPGELPGLMEHLPHCDVLVSYRDPRQRRENRMRKWISATDRALVQLFFGVALKDLHWIRFFRREILDRMILRSRSPSVDTEMIVAALRPGARIVEVPLDDHPREAGIARGARLKTLIRSAGQLVSLRLRPIRFAPEGKVGTLAADCDPTW